MRMIDPSGNVYTLLDSSHNLWSAANSSTSTVSAGYATDTYLAGSAIVIPAAGLWKVGTIYRCRATGLSNVVKAVAGVSSGFNSTTPTTIGVSFNGGTTFSGTCTLVTAELLGLGV
jgi:hypothetical protein